MRKMNRIIVRTNHNLSYAGLPKLYLEKTGILLELSSANHIYAFIPSNEITETIGLSKQTCSNKNIMEYKTEDIKEKRYCAINMKFGPTFLGQLNCYLMFDGAKYIGIRTSQNSMIITYISIEFVDSIVGINGQKYDINELNLYLKEE